MSLLILNKDCLVFSICGDSSGQERKNITGVEFYQALEREDQAKDLAPGER